MIPAETGRPSPVVRLRCDTCGDLFLRARAGRLAIPGRPGPAELHVTCPGCSAPLVVPVAPEPLAQLRAAGVTEDAWS